MKEANGIFKVIIAGGREFNDYNLLKKYCNHILKNKNNIEIVSGGARGADKLGEKYAQEKNYKLKIFPANWERYKKQAGFIRNIEMAEYADALIAFWDEKSKGTQHMIDMAKKQNLKIRICYYERTKQI